LEEQKKFMEYEQRGKESSEAEIVVSLERRELPDSGNVGCSHIEDSPF
jgi:hypothetical protein